MDSYTNELEQRLIIHKINPNNYQSLFDSKENENKFIELVDNYKYNLVFIKNSFLSTEYKL